MKIGVYWTAGKLARLLSFFFGLFPIAFPTHAQEDRLVVVEYAWSSNVDRTSRDYLRPPHGRRAPVRPLYFWMRVRGNSAALDQLLTDGALPIRHKWYRYVGPVIDPVQDSPSFDKELFVGAQRQSVIQALRREVEQTGYFHWRVWSVKEVVWPSVWEVRVVSADDQSLLCKVGKDLQPCQVRIRVAR